jgi:hypothetical protein
VRGLREASDAVIRYAAQRTEREGIEITISLIKASYLEEASALLELMLIMGGPATSGR